MNNNKGQVLVTFVLLLPFIILIITYLTSQGLILYEKNNLDNFASTICNYQNLDTKKLEKIILTNDENIKDIKIERENNQLKTIVLSKEYQTIFSKLINHNKYNIKIKKECKRGNNHER